MDVPRWLLVGLAVAVGGALLVGATTSGAAFGLYNLAWDGTAALRGVAEDAGAEVRVARNASAYADVPADGTVAVVGCSRSLRAATRCPRSATVAP